MRAYTLSTSDEFPGRAGWRTAGRTRQLIMLCLCLLAPLSGCPCNPDVEYLSNTSISGRISGHQVWSGTIHVTGDIWVSEHVRLTIEPGTTVTVAAMSDDQQSGDILPHDPLFPGDPDADTKNSVTIYIYGDLNATGTNEQPILFTSDSQTPTTCDWEGLYVSGGVLEHVIVEYARGNSLHASDLTIANSTFRNSLTCCICTGHEEKVSPRILDNEIYDCGHEGIDIAGGSPVIKGNHFYVAHPELQPDPTLGRGGTVTYRSATPDIENNVFESLRFGAAFHCETQKQPITFSGNTLKNNEQGIIVVCPANLITLENNSFINNSEDIVP